jgi:hypothetical protein
LGIHETRLEFHEAGREKLRAFGVSVRAGILSHEQKEKLGVSRRPSLIHGLQVFQVGASSTRFSRVEECSPDYAQSEQRSNDYVYCFEIHNSSAFLLVEAGGISLTLTALASAWFVAVSQ